MKKILIIVSLLGLTLNINYVSADTYVNGYIRNGEYIKSHFRTDRDGYKYNNWSTYLNVNPYTGKIGTIKAYDYKPYCFDYIELFPKFKKIDDFYNEDNEFQKREKYLKQFDYFCENYSMYSKYKNDEIEKPESIYKISKEPTYYDCTEGLENYIKSENNNFYGAYSNYILGRKFIYGGSLKEFEKILKNSYNNYLDEYSKLTTNSFSSDDINNSLKQYKRAQYAITIFKNDFKILENDIIKSCKNILNEEIKKEEKEIEKNKNIIKEKINEYEKIDKILDNYTNKEKFKTLSPFFENLLVKNPNHNKKDLIIYIINKLKSY